MNTSSNKTNGWGKPKYGASNFLKTGAPKEGDNGLRILPPMHSCAESGKWAIYESTHWGFYGVNSDPKGKPVARPFRCIQVKNRKTQIVEVECPACTEYDEQEKIAKAQLAELEKAGTSKDEIETIMASINGWLQDHRPERKWYVNVMYPDGTFGDYKLNHKFHKKGLDALIQKYQAEEGKDPLDLDDGCWFNINRTGKGINTVDKVDFAYDPIEVQVNGKLTKVQVIRTGALTDEQKDKALETCRDLHTLGGRVLTYEQIYELVNCDQEPDTVDKIMGVVQEASAPATKTVAGARKEKEAEKEKVEELKTVLKVTKTAFQNENKTDTRVVPTNDPAKTALAARAAKILADRKVKEEAEKVAAEKAKASETSAVDPNELDDEAFLKFFNEQETATQTTSA